MFVDLDEAVLFAPEYVAPQGGFDVESYSLASSVPELSRQDVFIGSAEERALEAIEVQRQTQARAAQAVLERLKKAYLAEVEQSVTSSQSEVERAYVESLDKAVDGLYELFVEHAKELEPLRYRLTRMVGFPDPDPRSLKVPLESNAKAYKNYLAARAVREQIIALGGGYKAEVERRLSLIRQARSAQRLSLEEGATASRIDALRRAQVDAEVVMNNARSALESTALDPESQLPAVPGATASVNSDYAAAVPARGGSRPKETRADLEAQLEVFLRAHGYRAAADASHGRDATRDFLEWRRKYVVGR